MEDSQKRDADSALTEGGLMSSELVTKEEAEGSIYSLLSGEKMQKQLRAALPAHCTPERLARLAMTQIRKAPKLLQCDRQSLLGAIMEASQLGLEIGSMGHAWLVPYGKEANLMIGYRGMVDLAWRSSKIKSVAAHVVWKEDAYEHQLGTDPYIRHVPADENDKSDPLNIRWVYAIVDTTTGGQLRDVMTSQDIESIRERSRSKANGPWVTDYAEMAKKTVLRRLLKLAPCSAELQRAVTLDEQAELGIPQDLGSAIDITPDGDVPYSETQTSEGEQPADQLGVREKV